MKKDESPNYYIHSKSGWTDEKVHAFRKQVREHNIWVRYAKDKGLKYNKKMEKWSAIHTTFKFFKMGRPPQLEVITQSPTLKTRIEMMNRICSAYKKKGIIPPDFAALNFGEIDCKLKQICNQLETHNSRK